MSLDHIIIVEKRGRLLAPIFLGFLAEPNPDATGTGGR
jgi:hypothetical protein